MSYPTAKVIRQTLGESVVSILEEDLHKVSMGETGAIGNDLEIRTWGDFVEKAFFLSSSYDWMIAKDRDEMLILIPTKKKKK